ncbi:MAG: SAF domain-containing protein [Pseudomonadota bacterium]
MEIVWEAVGRVDYGLKSSEKGNAQFCRSLHVVEDIPAGGELTTENVQSIQPGFGLAPEYYDEILGCRAKGALTRGTALKLHQLQS